MLPLRIAGISPHWRSIDFFLEGRRNKHGTTSRLSSICDGVGGNYDWCCTGRWNPQFVCVPRWCGLSSTSFGSSRHGHIYALAARPFSLGGGSLGGGSLDAVVAMGGDIICDRVNAIPKATLNKTESRSILLSIPRTGETIEISPAETQQRKRFNRLVPNTLCERLLALPPSQYLAMSSACLRL